MKLCIWSISLSAASTTARSADDEIPCRSGVLRVVFDAQNGPSASPETDHRGVRVHFAFRQTADDLIEELLAAQTRPRRMTVVSNDVRIQKAGHRRGATVQTCEEFVDWLISDVGQPRPLPQPEPEKPEPDPTADEMATWLAAFSSPPPKRRKR